MLVLGKPLRRRRRRNKLEGGAFFFLLVLGEEGKTQTREKGRSANLKDEEEERGREDKKLYQKKNTNEAERMRI